MAREVGQKALPAFAGIFAKVEPCFKPLSMPAWRPVDQGRASNSRQASANSAGFAVTLSTKWKTASATSSQSSGFRQPEHLADLLETGVAAGEGGYRIEDVFDTFTHWLVAIRHFPVSRHWKVAPGEGARYWDDWLEGGHMSIGWNDLGDLSRLSREEFEQKRDEMVEADEDMKPDRLEQVWKFAHEIREGDKIVANQGTGKVLGFGTVSGPYAFLSDEDDHGHRRPVDWDDTVPRQVSEGGWRRTLVSLEREKFEELVDTDPAIEQPPDHFTQETFDLLRDLEEEPTRDFYSARQDAFKGRLELPFQDLFSRVVEKLPDDILERMEAEKNVFSRVPKNDYGRGGAWPFYWGALYPEGGRRIEAAQLLLVIKKDRPCCKLWPTPSLLLIGSSARTRHERAVTARHGRSGCKAQKRQASTSAATSPGRRCCDSPKTSWHERSRTFSKISSRWSSSPSPTTLFPKFDTIGG